MRDGLRATVAAYQQQIPIVEKAASDAGEAASKSYTQAQQDQAAESALALAEVQYQLAQQEGIDGGPAYKAGLQAALAYWRGRLAGLTLGTPEYTTALQKIVDLEGKVTNLKGNTGLADSLKSAAAILGKNSPLQASLTAGLDGLADYFAAGGKAGGRGAILQGASALVGGLVDVFKTGDEDVDRVVSTFVSGIQGTLTQLAQGNWMGAIVAGVATVVSTVIDIFTGGANSAKKSAEEIKQATKDIHFFDTSKYAKTVSRGGFFGWLGFKKSQIDQESVDIAKNLGDAIYNAITSGMLDGIKTGKASFADLGIDLKKALGEQILQGLIDGFMKGAVMQGILQPFLDSYVQAMKSGNAQALAAASEGIQNAAVSANTQLQQFYEGVLVPISQRLGNFGSDTSGTGTGSSSSNDLFGNAPSVQLGVPRVEVSLPADTFKPLTTFASTLPTWERITTNLDNLLSSGANTTTQGSAGTDARAMLLFSTAVPAWAAAVPVFAEGAADLKQGVAEWRAFMAGSGSKTTNFTGNGGLT